MKITFKILLIYLIFFSLSAGSLLLLYSFDILKIYFEKNFLLIIILISLTLLIPLIFTFYLSYKITRNTKLISRTLSHFFSEENFQDKLIAETKRKDEFGTVYQELSELQKTYQKYTEFVENLKSGNFKIPLQAKKEEALGVALLDIKENLIFIEKERKLNSLELERNNWYQSGVTEFTVLLQQDFKSTEEMAYPVIKKLAEHLSIEQAGMFVLKQKNEKELLILEAAYAYDKKKQLDTEIEIGESLAGKCAKEQKLIRIDDLPEGYTYISSGLGEDTPKSLILMPLLYEKKLYGVLEIASLKRISDYRINFLNVISERIAAEISNINSKILTTKLAEDYKKQSEELALKEHKSEEIISELTEEKEKLYSEYYKLIEYNKLINSTAAIVIFNSERKVSDINKTAEELYNLKKETYLNKTAEEFFKNTNKDPGFAEKIFKGETLIFRYLHNNNTEELIEQYKPVKNNENKIENIILTALLIKKS